MRLIDADALKRKAVPLLFPTKMEPCGHIPVPVNSVVVAEIEQAPTIDAVPVVRCKDCKHSELEFFVDNGTIRIEKYKCGNHLGMGMAQEVNADDFCSYGERKEGAD